MNPHRVEPCWKCGKLLPVEQETTWASCPTCKAPKPHAEVEYDYWKEFEARDREKNPAAWAVHDHMTGRTRSRRWLRLSWTEAAILLVLLILFLFVFL